MMSLKSIEHFCRRGKRKNVRGSNSEILSKVGTLNMGGSYKRKDLKKKEEHITSRMNFRGEGTKKMEGVRKRKTVLWKKGRVLKGGRVSKGEC